MNVVKKYTTASWCGRKGTPQLVNVVGRVHFSTWMWLKILLPCWPSNVIKTTFFLFTQCKFCGKAFASHAAHDSHVRRTHVKEKSPQCKYCGAEFSQQHELKVHYRSHHSGAGKYMNHNGADSYTWMNCLIWIHNWKNRLKSFQQVLIVCIVILFFRYRIGSVVRCRHITSGSSAPTRLKSLELSMIFRKPLFSRYVLFWQ